MKGKKIVALSLFLLVTLLFSNFVLASNAKELALKLNRLDLMDGDVNADGKVDIYDLVAIGLNYGKTEADADWNWKTDVANTVGEIDIFDLAEVGLNYGKTYTQNIEDPVFISPESKNAVVLSEFSINVSISTPANVYALDFELSFDPSLVQVLNIKEGNFLKKDGKTTSMSLCELGALPEFCPVINNTSGRIEFANSRLGTETTVTGDGTLAVINFKAFNLGTSPLNFISFSAVDNNLNEIIISTINGTINVINEPNEPPVLSGIPDKQTDENTAPPANWVDLYPYASDVEDPDTSLTFSIVSQTNSALINCYISSNRYLSCNKPALNQNGFSDVIVKVIDTKGASATDTARIVVSSVNSPPIAYDDNAVTNEDTLITIDVLANDIDVEGAVNLDSITTQPSHGSAVISEGKIRYTPTKDYYGTDSFVYKIRDADGATDTATVSITINSVNDAPVAYNDNAITNEDTLITIDVLANDKDVDSSLTLSKITASPLHGSASIQSNKIYYTPNINYYGIDSLEYEVSDSMLTDTATVSITINSVNDKPKIDSYSPLTNPSIQEKQNQGFSITASDEDGDVLTIKWYLDGQEVASGNSYNYISDYASQGMHEVKVVISDGKATTEHIWQLTVLDIYTRIFLKAGNNIFSLPRNQEKSFNELGTNCNVVSEGGRADLAYYTPSGENISSENYVFIGLNEILYPGQGYFVKVVNDCYAEMSGGSVTISDLGYIGTKQLKTGWNLVGAPTNAQKFNAGTCQLFGGVGILKYAYDVNSCQQVEGYNGGYAYCSVEGGISRCRCQVNNFEPGLGYWIRTANECVL